MKRINVLIVVATLATVISSCSKDISLKEPNQRIASLKSNYTDDFPYELYEPSGQGEVYEQLENGLVNLFDTESSPEAIDIAYGVFLWEAGVNYLHLSETMFANDSAGLTSGGFTGVDRTVTVSKVDGEILSEQLRGQIQVTYEDVEDVLQSGNYIHAGTDVQFVEETSTTISFRIASYFYFIEWWNYIPNATVQSATTSKMVGTKSTNCALDPYAYGAWVDMQHRVKQTFKMKWAAYNMVAFDTYIYTGNKYMDGEWMPGATNALYPAHDGPNLHITTCLSIQEQNNYAQELRDRIASKMNSSNGWFNKVAYLRVDNNSDINAQTTYWGFQVNLTNFIDGPLSTVTAGDLF